MHSCAICGYISPTSPGFIEQIQWSSNWHVQIPLTKAFSILDPWEACMLGKQDFAPFRKSKSQSSGAVVWRKDRAKHVLPQAVHEANAAFAGVGRSCRTTVPEESCCVATLRLSRPTKDLQCRRKKPPICILLLLQRWFLLSIMGRSPSGYAWQVTPISE